MNIGRLDLNLLLTFRALLAERSVTRAAVRLGITQPAMSNALSRLRTSLGDPLFIRGPRGITPTPRSLEIAPAIEAALQTLETIFPGGGFDPATAIHRFTIVCPDDVEILLIPRIMQLLEHVAPGVSLAIRRPASLFGVPQAELESGAADFAIGPYADPAPQSRLHAFSVAESGFVGVLAGHLPFPHGRLTLEAFAAMRHVAVYYPGEGPGLVDRLLAQQGLSRQVVLSAPQFITAIHYAARSGMIAVVPQAIARHFETALAIRIVRLPLPLPPYRQQLVWHARTLESPSHRWFRELVDRASQTPSTTTHHREPQDTRRQKRK